MNPTLRIILTVLAVGILTKLVLGGKTDKGIDLSKLLKDDALLIDTRTGSEFSHGHIEGAVNIPHNIIAQKIGEHTTDPSKPIIVYCHSGARSASAKRSLRRAGYTNVVNGGSLHRMHRLFEK